MKKIPLKISVLAMMLCSAAVFGQENDSIAVKKQKTTESKEENNRNVMLNAANNTGPREVNIGLPASVGGITILENDMPVVHFFWPEMPTKTWRQSVSLGRTGLMKMGEAAITQGELGFAVNSYTKIGTEKTEVVGNLSGSHFGWIKGDLNVSGPIAKNWSYTAGAFLNFDPQSFDAKFTNYADRTQIYRFGVTKRFDNNKGEISVLYKYAKSASLSNYAVFKYKEGGKVEEIDGFKIGRDAYILNTGMYKFKNLKTGEYMWADMGGKDNESFSHVVDVLGNYKLNNDWNLKFAARGRYAEATIFMEAPISIFNATAADGFTDKTTGQAYTGYVSTVLGMYSPHIPTKTLMGRVELNKKTENHDWRVGITESYYHVDQFVSNRSFYYQKAEANPGQLLRNVAGGTSNTDADGFYGYNLGAEYHDGSENKLAGFFSDSWTVSDRFSVNYGANLRLHTLDGSQYLTTRTPGFVLADGTPTYFKDSWFQISGDINAVYKLTKNFGLLAEFLYVEKNGQLESYSGNVVPNLQKTKSPMGAFGVYYNNPKFSLVSQVNYLTKNNYLARPTLVNPNNSTETYSPTVYYDIQTLGWTTDIVINPFKGFNLHYLITLQNPVYKNFDFSAFGSNYSYDDKNVLSISKVLMEIDPSYSFDKFRIWASFRYFSKQYANYTNVLFFAPRWETFGGANYRINNHFDIGVTVVNFLNQRGASGSITGAELITDPSPYYDKYLTGSYIRPFTLEASLNFRF